MGEFWEEIVSDPIALDLLVILQDGFYEFEAAKLTCLPDFFGTGDRPASASEIQKRLLPLLMNDDPGKERAAKDLSQNTKVNLALFRASGDSKSKTRKGAQEIAGHLHKPESPISASAVSKRPSKKQPRGGIEWKHLLAIRRLIIQWAHDHGCPLPEGLVGATPAENQVPNPTTSPSGQDDSSEGGASTHDSPQTTTYLEDRDKLDEPLFERGSFKLFLRELSEAQSLTIFVGAGASADLGIPLHRELMPRVVHQAAKDLSDLHGLTSKMSKRRVEAVLDLLGDVSSVYLGSIARELASTNTAIDMDAVLRNGLNIETTDSASQPGGFLARGIAALAFSVRAAGKNVSVITTNYDATIPEEAEYKLHNHMPELKNYGFKVITWPSADTAGAANMKRWEYFEQYVTKASPKEQAIVDQDLALKTYENKVPLYYANGKLEQYQDIVLAEMDFLKPKSDQDKERFEARSALLTRALETTTCLFVGSSVTDPDMLSRLASLRKKDGQHYAILLAPDIVVPASASPGEAKKVLRRAEAEHKLARKFAARRFRHLDITPLLVDFPFQAPQVLREVGLEAQQGTSYRSYGKRLDDWWKIWHMYLGFSGKKRGRPSRRRPVLMQEAWRLFLAELCTRTIPGFFKDQRIRVGKETFKAELWLRDVEGRDLKYPPINDVRSLFLWATSDGVMLDGTHAVWGPVSIKTHNHYLAQRVFREGRTLAEPTDTPRGLWRYIVGMPLVLHKDPWFHLPVGVLTIFSDAMSPKGALYKAVDEDGKRSTENVGKEITNAAGQVEEVRYTVAEMFEDRVKQGLNEILASETPLLALGEHLAVAQQNLGTEATEKLRAIDAEAFEEWEQRYGTQSKSNNVKS